MLLNAQLDIITIKVKLIDFTKIYPKFIDEHLKNTKIKHKLGSGYVELKLFSNYRGFLK